MGKIEITWEEVFKRLLPIDKPENIIYGVPKGGMILCAFLKKAKITSNPKEANLILDDLIDSGRTRNFYQSEFPFIPFYSLYEKQNSNWIIFPWEKDHPSGQDSIEDNIVRQLQYIGEDPNREGLKETPQRIIRSWNEIFGGYGKESKDLFKTFSGDGYSQIILLKDIEVFSMCEHHWLPFFGKAHVAYIPKDKIIGISKLARLVEVYARRLQIQERLGEQVTQSLMDYLEPEGAACIIDAVHMCMRMRGVSKQHSSMVTSSLKGIFIADNQKGIAARNELMRLIG